MSMSMKKDIRENNPVYTLYLTTELLGVSRSYTESLSHVAPSPTPHIILLRLQYKFIWLSEFFPKTDKLTPKTTFKASAPFTILIPQVNKRL